jgi:hypothetical protein
LTPSGRRLRLAAGAGKPVSGLISPPSVLGAGAAGAAGVGVLGGGDLGAGAVRVGPGDCWSAGAPRLLSAKASNSSLMVSTSDGSMSSPQMGSGGSGLGVAGGVAVDLGRGVGVAAGAPAWPARDCFVGNATGVATAVGVTCGVSVGARVGVLVGVGVGGAWRLHPRSAVDVATRMPITHVSSVAERTLSGLCRAVVFGFSNPFSSGWVRSEDTAKVGICQTRS